MAEYNPYQAPAVDDFGTPRSLGYGGEITAQIMDVMGQTRPWVKFLGIVGFIGAGLMALGGLFVALSSSTRSASNAFDNNRGLMGFLYLVFAVFYVFPSYYLVRYASAIQRFTSSGEIASLGEALQVQKSFWKMIGIATAVIIGLYALIFVGAILMAIGKH